MDEELKKIQQKAIELKKENQKFLAKLKQKPPKNLDTTMQQLHDDTFEEIDCLTCSNCCKTTVPIITDKDSQRIAKFLKMKVYDFETKYVNIEKDNSKSFKSAPCVFLMPDNYCMIYEVRPKACAEFPHTNRKRFHQITKITLENTVVCPATSIMIENLKKITATKKPKRSR